MKVMQSQMLQNYEFLPAVIIQYTMHYGKMNSRPFSHCGFWRAVIDAMTPCFKETILKLSQQ